MAAKFSCLSATTTGRLNGLRVALWLESSSVCCPIHPPDLNWLSSSTFVSLKFLNCLFFLKKKWSGQKNTIKIIKVGIFTWIFGAERESRVLHISATRTGGRTSEMLVSNEAVISSRNGFFDAIGRRQAGLGGFAVGGRWLGSCHCSIAHSNDTAFALHFNQLMNLSEKTNPSIKRKDFF